MYCVIVHDKHLVDCVSALNFCVFCAFVCVCFLFFLLFFAHYTVMPTIDCDNGWPAFDGCMPFWQLFCIINCCLVTVFILFMENELSLLCLQVTSPAKERL